MAVDIEKLRDKIKSNHLSLPEFAKQIGINPSTLYRKLEANGEGMTVGEIHKTVEVLKLSKKEATAIFLP